MQAYLRTLFAFFLCLYAYHSGGQIQGSISEASVLNKNIPFTITSYSTKDGLPQNHIAHILRRKNGEMIVHTFNGIVSFNGYRFSLVSQNRNYQKQYFKSLHYFDKTDMLVGHDWHDMLYIISPTYESFSIPGCRPLVCVSNNDSLLIISVTGNVYLYDPLGRQSKLLFKNEGPPIVASSMYATHAVQQGKHIYFSTERGIYCVNLNGNKIEQLSTENCHVLKKDPQNQNVYAVFDNSIALVRHNTITKISNINTSIPHGHCSDMLITDSSAFYLATDNGLIHIQGNKTTHYTRADGFPAGALQALFYDPLNQCIFAGSTEKGLLKLLFKNNYTIALPENHYQKSVSSVARSATDGIITQAGPYIYQIGSDVRALFLRGRGENASLATIDDKIYLGTWGEGLIIYNNHKLWDTIIGPKHLPDNVVHATFRDSKGRIWIGTNHGIARGTSPSTVKPILGQYIYEAIVCFYEMHDGTICIGTSLGAYMVRNDSIVNRFTRDNGFRGKETRFFYEDAQGHLWMGSYGGGMYRFDKGRYRSVNAMKNCMLYEDVFCMAPDNYGYIYMTSNRGLWRISEKDLNAFYNREIGYLIPFHYTEESGYTNTEFNGGFQNNFQRDGNTFIFPTIEGLVRTVPEKPVYQQASPTISNVWVNDTLLSDPNRNVFPRSTHSLQFEFECQNFVAKNNVHFQYRLSGETSYDWSTPQKQTRINLNVLQPGKYTLTVRAIDAFNDRKPRVATYTFEILPHIYETVWFMASGSLLLAVAVGFMIRFRISNNRKKIEQREYYRRKISEVELHAIQAQLNPHFIFNCMNTIKYFILEKNFSHANEGLNRLSKLIRNSMENSEKLFASLKQEVTFFTNYIELEKMRLRELLSYTITIANDVPLHCTVPHLFIQPHIENAIKHGISNLENKQGMLSIDIRQNERDIICTIQDNGIGRKASAKLLEDMPHVSKGSRLTLEKSQLLKQYYRYRCSIEITDLFDETGQSEGTRVVITMQKRERSENLVSL